MKLKLLVIALLAVSLAAAAPQAQLPDTPAGHQFAAWLEAFNSGDRAKLLEYLQKNDPAHAGEIEGEMGFRRMTGGFKFMKVEESTPTRFTGIIRERESDTFARFAMETEAAEPHHITKFDLEQIPIPAEFAPPRLSQADTLAALRSELDKQAADDKFSGAVLIAKDGKPVFTAAYGMADREKKIPNRLDTQFRIGSMNKMFTAVSMLQFVQAGKIKLTDPLGKYIPDYPNKDVASKVTIHDLLTHTGGTGDFFGPEFDKHRLELRTLQDYLKLFGQRGLEFEPGSKWAYSNYGFLLLGVVIEKVSGQSHYDYVAEHVYKSAGMTLTASLPEDEAVPGRSVGYTRRPPRGAGASAGPRERRLNTDTLPYRGTSAEAAIRLSRTYCASRTPSRITSCWMRSTRSCWLPAKWTPEVARNMPTVLATGRTAVCNALDMGEELRG